MPLTFVLLGMAGLLWLVWTYNRLVTLQNVLREAWSGIDVQLKRRHDLVPQLVTSVQTYRDHERALLESVAHARAAAQAAHTPHDAAPAENALSHRLRDLLVVVEGYPELEADANFRQLATQLADTEDQLQYARRYFNGAVRDFNNRVESFPSLLVARGFGFTSAEFFTVDSALERSTPPVRL